MLPAWRPCECCEEFWCTIHNMHAYECDCPPVDEWEVDPYTSRPPETDHNDTGNSHL